MLLTHQHTYVETFYFQIFRFDDGWEWRRRSRWVLMAWFHNICKPQRMQALIHSSHTPLHLHTQNWSHNHSEECLNNWCWVCECVVVLDNNIRTETTTQDNLRQQHHTTWSTTPASSFSSLHNNSNTWYFLFSAAAECGELWNKIKNCTVIIIMVDSDTDLLNIESWSLIDSDWFQEKDLRMTNLQSD